MTEEEPRAPGVKKVGNGLLIATVVSPNHESARHRSASVTPSIRSTNTTVEEDPDKSDLIKSFRRQQTFEIRAKLSLWDRLMGVFYPRMLLEKIGSSIVTVDSGVPDEEMFDDGECPFILTVSTWPKDNPGPGNFHSAKCVFDTGCMQGNLVSKNLVLELGYTELDFKKLRPRERNGGTTATGDILSVEGALNLSWHHGSSSQIFRDMRFLVSDAKDFDMIVGARSITKHSLISPPSLSIVNVNPSEAKDLELRDNVSTLESVVEDLKEDLKNPSKDQNKTRKKIETKQLELDIAKLRAERYDAENKGKIEEVESLQKDIDDLESKKEEKESKKKEKAKKKADTKLSTPPSDSDKPEGKKGNATGGSSSNS